jgi:hypothetical protein
MSKYLQFGNKSKWILMMFLFSSFLIVSCSDDMEQEPSPDISDTTKVDSLKGARIQAVTTQSTYWKFIDDNGIPFKHKGNIKIWVFPNPISEEEIDSKVENGTLGTPKINSNFTEKSFDANNEIRKILAFNSVLWVKVVFAGSAYESDRTYTNMYYHYDRIVKLPKGTKRTYQHYVFDNIDRQKGQF